MRTQQRNRGHTRSITLRRDCTRRRGKYSRGTYKCWMPSMAARCNRSQLDPLARVSCCWLAQFTKSQITEAYNCSRVCSVSNYRAQHACSDRRARAAVSASMCLDTPTWLVVRHKCSGEQVTQVLNHIIQLFNMAIPPRLLTADAGVAYPMHGCTTCSRASGRSTTEVAN
ncbi:unnamed protein product [Trichogramma brassicae]|uniref:Uncharacterized protein n=1 Tax=Trichogramma brassicae TaxID=86971 RepID=A0A6H5HUV2_9HYME|nr:unnamed protein product [Trichogramma brassicae]